MNEKDIWSKILGDDSSPANNSLAGQYGSASRSLHKLRGLRNDGQVTDEQYGTIRNSLNSSRAQAGAGIVGAGLSGLSSIADSMKSLASVGDTGIYDNAIGDINDIGTMDFSDYGQISQAYTDLGNIQPDLNDDQAFRGLSGRDKVAGIGKATLSGASAGMTIGGPWGALIGGAVGALGSTGAMLSGNKKAKTNQDLYRYKTMAANDAAQSNLSSSIDGLADRQFRDARKAALGGQIFKPKKHTMPRSNERRYGNVIRTRDKGGVIIRIKH